MNGVVGIGLVPEVVTFVRSDEMFHNAPLCFSGNAVAFGSGNF